MPTTSSTLRLLDQLREQIAGLTDAQARDLVAAYARSFDEIAGDLEAALGDVMANATGTRVSRAAVRRSQRLSESLAIIVARLRGLAEASEVRIVGDLDAAIQLAGRVEVDLIRSQLPPTPASTVLVAGFDRVDEDALKILIERTTQQIHSRTLPLSDASVDAVRRELVRGIAIGDNPNRTASRIVARVQGAFEGGAARATRIARTETLDAMRAASRLADKANPSVTGWQWLCDLSTRTCPACLSMHGSTHPVSEPGPLGHPNCRCTGIPVVKPWADLGFADIEEPPDLLPDAQAFFDGLTPDEQKGILGAKGVDAYNAGRYPMSAWAQRQTNDGWRDSYVVARPPSLVSDRLAS